MVGMAGMMAGVLHAPLTAIFLIAELTGGYQLFCTFNDHRIDFIFNHTIISTPLCLYNGIG